MQSLDSITLTAFELQLVEAVLCKPGGHSIYKVLNKRDIVQTNMPIYSVIVCFFLVCALLIINNAHCKLTVNVRDFN